MKKTPSRIWTIFHLWRLGNKWTGGRSWYQYIDFGGGITTEAWSHGKAKLRTESFLAFLQGSDYLRSDDIVVDIGCNAGLFSLIAAQKCAQVHGVEIDLRFIRQAEFVKSYWDSIGRRVDNVKFLLCDITQKLDLFSKATVVFASKVLYHKNIGDRFRQLMDAIQNSPVRLILVQGHTTQGEKGQDEGMRILMSKYSFDYQMVENVPEYPIGIAKRNLGS